MSTTSELAPAVYGSMTSFCSPILYSIAISYAWPSKYDWREFLRVEALVRDSGDSSPSNSSPGIVESSPGKDEESNEKTTELVRTRNAEDTSDDGQVQSLDDVQHPFDAQTLTYLHKWYKVAWVFFIFVMLLLWVLWSMPLYRDYIFSKAFYSGWVTVSIILQFFALFAVVVYPIYDGWAQISAASAGIWTSLRRKFLSRK